MESKKKYELKEYKFGVENSRTGVYLIDSNMLIAFANYYYTGKCNPLDNTQTVVDFLIRAREYRIFNGIALMELCYDYETNRVDNFKMQKFMIPYDYLIQSMERNEIINHRGALKPEYINNVTNDAHEIKYHSIYDSKLPDLMFDEEVKDFRDLFYVVYLYILKIYSLYNNRDKSEIDKIKELITFMTDEIGVILAYELGAATMLFIGENKDKDIIKKILKPRQTPELKHILNATIDVLQVVLAEVLYQELTCTVGLNVIVGFATLDKSLQEYIECTRSFPIVAPNTSPVISFSSQIDVKYKEEWERYYKELVSPIMKERYVFPRISQIPSEKVKNDISLLEKEIYRI